MNILPKKSWHVRSKKNIERVRRDEAEAEKSEKIEQNRKFEIEREARKRELRIRAGLPVDEHQGHINLFQDYEEKKQESNKEDEEENLQEEKKQQERAGIFNKLGRSEDVNRPWYCKPTNSSSCLDGAKQISKDLGPPKTTTSSELPGLKRSNQITSIYDPLIAIKDAERIVRAKREKRKEQERLFYQQSLLKFHDYDFYRLTRPPQISSEGSVELKSVLPLLPKLTKLKPPQGVVEYQRESDSSPEIIKIVKAPKKSVANKEKVSKRKHKKSKKHKKVSKSHYKHHHKKHKKK